jgi:hypothetical protein
MTGGVSEEGMQMQMDSNIPARHRGEKIDVGNDMKLDPLEPDHGIEVEEYR